MDSIFSSDPTETAHSESLEIAGRIIGLGFARMLDEEKQKQADLATALDSERAAKTRAEGAAAEFQRKIAEQEAEMLQRREAYERQIDEQQRQVNVPPLPAASATPDELEEMRNTLTGAYAQLAAERVARIAAEQQSAARQTRPDKISCEPHRGIDGLLRGVMLKAEGYEDIAISVLRGADNRMVQLKIGA